MTAESNDNQEKSTETNNNKVLHVVGENDELVRWGIKHFIEEKNILVLCYTLFMSI